MAAGVIFFLKILNISLKSIDIYIYRCYNKIVRKIKPQQKGKVKIMRTEDYLNVSVEQMINDRGNGAMNQFVIHDGDLLMFQSYSSLIAVVNYATKEIILSEDWDYSVTTGKHRNIFFRDYANIPDLMSANGIRKALKNGLCNGWKISLA